MKQYITVGHKSIWQDGWVDVTDDELKVIENINKRIEEQNEKEKAEKKYQKEQRYKKYLELKHEFDGDKSFLEKLKNTSESHANNYRKNSESTARIFERTEEYVLGKAMAYEEVVDYIDEYLKEGE
jgi:hypothetical protein